MQPALLWVLAVALMLVGLAGVVLPALPGVPLMFAGMLIAAWIDDFTRIRTITLVILGVLTLFTLLIDFAAGALGAQRVGASRQAIVGAALGSVVGLFFGLPGLLLGPFIGGVAGELAGNRGVNQALRVGVASWLGFFLGTLMKIAIAFAMLGVFGLDLVIE
jgi:uncharacterized protein YqgC (DUF456 family)